MYEFMTDLDDYFCEKYENYDKICALKGYKMPVMQATKRDEFGREVGYTLPKTEMRLALQEKKTELLAALKAETWDKTFSFSFTPYSWTERISQIFSANAFHKRLAQLMQAKKYTKDEVAECLTIRKEIWDGVCNGKFAPTKNLVFSLAFAMQLNTDELNALLWLIYQKIDFSEVKDVVVYYLIEKGIYHADKVRAAFAEYRVENLFLA